MYIQAGFRTAVIFDLDDIGEPHAISHCAIRNGSKFYVEYTPEAWS